MIWWILGVLYILGGIPARKWADGNWFRSPWNSGRGVKWTATALLIFYLPAIAVVTFAVFVWNDDEDFL